MKDNWINVEKGVDNLPESGKFLVVSTEYGIQIACEVDKVGVLVEALDNIITHYERMTNGFDKLSTACRIAKQELLKYKEGE